MYGLFTDFHHKLCYLICHLRSDKALTIYLLAGPPFGPPFWDSCIKRLHFHGRKSQTLNPFQHSGQLDEISQIVAAKLQENDISSLKVQCLYCKKNVRFRLFEKIYGYSM